MCRQIRAALDPEFHVHLLEMIIDRSDGHEESCCDLAAGQVLGGKQGDFTFPI